MNAQKLETIETMKNKLTNKYELNIQFFPSAGLPKEKLEWVNNIKQLWITIRKIIKRELIRKKKKEIKHKIELRQEFLSTKSKHIIDKVLDRDSRQILLDRIINTQEDGTTQIITDPTQIKDKVKEHLYQWTKGTQIDTSIKNT
ncbi:5190_t:CDS:1, partial [Diversispora eburnea]